MPEHAINVSSRFLEDLAGELSRAFEAGIGEIRNLVAREHRRLQKVLAGKKARNISNPEAYLRRRCTYCMEHRRKDPETAWKEALIAEDSAAWKQLYKVCYHKTIALLRRKSCPEEQAHDIWQNAAVALLEQLRDDTRCFIDQKLVNYVNTLALYTWYKEVRKKNKTVSWDTFYADVPHDDVEEYAEGDHFLTVELYDREEPLLSENIFERIMTLITNGIRKISNKRHRDILQWLLIDQLSREEVAKRSGHTLKNLRTPICRALQELRVILISEFKKDPDLYFWLRRLRGDPG
jgi:DNA-directed RNA polymerase specialized sigma24 family protein